MRLEQWDSEAHLPILHAWSETDDRITKLLGSEVTDKDLDRVIPIRVLVFNDAGSPVAMFGMMKMGPSLAVVHVIGSPDRKSLGAKAEIVDAYKMAEDFAREQGVKILYTQIPNELVESIRMAEHVGFTQLPYVQLVKGLN